jgi:hypothetical protein
MLGFDSIACVASGDMLGDVFLHVLPPEVLPQVSVHLSAARVYAIFGIVRLSQDFISQDFIVRHADSAFAPAGPLFVLVKLRRRTPFHDPTEFLDH